jgi:hypothetical protein
MTEPSAQVCFRVLNVRYGWKADDWRDSCSHVDNFLAGRRGAVIVVALIVLQLVILLFSMGPLVAVSLFCTGSGGSPDGTVFTAIHYMFAIELLVGLGSLHFERVRFGYAVLLIVLLCSLPVQAHMVAKGDLQCDLP